MSYTEKKIFTYKKARNPINNALKLLINNDKLSDTQFSVGIHNKIYHGIGALFAINSPKFKDLLYKNNNDDDKENDDEASLGGLDDIDNNIIPLNHVTCSSFEFIQSYFYQQPKKITPDILIDILFIAKEFQLKNIEQKCYESIEIIKKTNEYIPYLIKMVNQLYHRGEYEMAKNMLLSTNYVIVEFVFISLSHINGNNINGINNTHQPIYYAVAVKL